MVKWKLIDIIRGLSTFRFCTLHCSQMAKMSTHSAAFSHCSPKKKLNWISDSNWKLVWNFSVGEEIPYDFNVSIMLELFNWSYRIGTALTKGSGMHFDYSICVICLAMYLYRQRAIPITMWKNGHPTENGKLIDTNTHTHTYTPNDEKSSRQSAIDSGKNASVSELHRTTKY